jgi:hypothetical protein
MLERREAWAIVHKILPLFPKQFRSLDKLREVLRRPRCLGAASHQPVQPVGTDELALVSIHNPVEALDECVLISAAKFLRRYVIEQALQIIRRSDAIRD